MRVDLMGYPANLITYTLQNIMTEAKHYCMVYYTLYILPTGGLLICMPKENAVAFCEEIQVCTVNRH